MSVLDESDSVLFDWFKTLQDIQLAGEYVESA